MFRIKFYCQKIWVLIQRNYIPQHQLVKNKSKHWGQEEEIKVWQGVLQERG
jgi:hypothetical protein